LDEVEWVRARRFRTEKLRRTHVAAHGQLKWLLSFYLAIEPSTVGFVAGAHGKPRLAGTAPNRGLVFNLSHSASHLFVAVAREAMLGVDVEVWRPITHLDAMVQRCLTPAERHYWSSLDAGRRLAAFYDFWTCKEAFVKAVGEGLSLGLKRCIVGLEPHPHFLGLPRHCGDANEWSLLAIDAGEGASSALAVRPSCRRVLYGRLGRGWWRDDGFAATARRLK
jgi:4'-phosphopantetheinyl transferase